jgi:hypothetical protein
VLAEKVCLKGKINISTLIDVFQHSLVSDEKLDNKSENV